MLVVNTANVPRILIGSLLIRHTRTQGLPVRTSDLDEEKAFPDNAFSIRATSSAQMFGWPVKTGRV